jgi:uncharacterized protein
MQFSWDPRKALRNRDKHAVDFTEALTVFRDPLARIFDDDDHLEFEHRELIIGYSNLDRLLIVAFTEREDGIRIISARTANQRERSDYEKAKR